MRRYAALVVAGLLLLGPARDAAGQVYPTRPIKLVIPFAPGGGADVVGRLLAERITGILQQPVLVENRPGRGGTLATEAVAKADPDGYTLLYVTSATFVTSPIFLRMPGYDPLSSFAPISLVSLMKSVVAVNPSVPARNLEELTALLKAAPGKYRAAHGGVGTHSYLSGELFKSQTGLDVRELAVKGPTAAIESVAKGDADIAIDLSVMLASAIREGRVRPIAVMGLARVPNFPEIPTTVEAGMPELTAYSWTGVVAPAGTPPQIVEVINRAVGSILSEIETQATFVKYGLQAEGSTPAEFHGLIRAELTKWSRALPLSATAPR